MGSSELVEALQVLQPFVYGGLFLVALFQWRRRPVRPSAWLVATFGVLAAVVIAGQILPEDSTQPVIRWAGKALIAILVRTEVASILQSGSGAGPRERRPPHFDPDREFWSGFAAGRSSAADYDR
jgi:peptidoglycan/LPS O-acetylase OafA/YrhL